MYMSSSPKTFNYEYLAPIATSVPQNILFLGFSWKLFKLSL